MHPGEEYDDEEIKRRFHQYDGEDKETYADFQPEMDMTNRAFAEVMMEGVGVI